VGYVALGKGSNPLLPHWRKRSIITENRQIEWKVVAWVTTYIRIRSDIDVSNMSGFWCFLNISSLSLTDSGSCGGCGLLDLR
jgi:hypothetical protein